jgi:D-ribose pyranase
MKEVGTVNRSIAKVISEQGHQDLLMVVDAGFAIPKEVEVIDISLGENNPNGIVRNRIDK